VAAQQPIFDLTLSGTVTMNADRWIDLGAIPNGQAILVGYATLIAQDKNLQFELRTNKSGQSAGTAAATDLLDWCAAQGGTGVDRDLYWGGNINTLTVQGSGVEHWWLHATSQSSSSGVLDYIIRYTVQ
jgi:hypothetical protein